MPIIANQYKGKVQVRVINGAQETITPSATAIANTGELLNGLWGETVDKLHITKVLWSGNTTIARGSNTLLQLQGSGEWALGDEGIALTEDETATVVITTTAGGSAIVELKKP